jgi:hypothetical protein
MRRIPLAAVDGSHVPPPLSALAAEAESGLGAELPEGLGSQLPVQLPPGLGSQLPVQLPPGLGSQLPEGLVLQLPIRLPVEPPHLNRKPPAPGKSRLPGSAYRQSLDHMQPVLTAQPLPACLQRPLEEEIRDAVSSAKIRCPAATGHLSRSDQSGVEFQQEEFSYSANDTY